MHVYEGFITGQLAAIGEAKVLEVDEGCERSDVTYHTAPHNGTNLS